MAKPEFARVSRSTINGVFALLAAVLAFTSYMLHTGGDYKWAETRVWIGEVTKDIAVVIFSLALVDFLWRRFGGDPLDNHIQQVETHLSETVHTLRQSQVLLSQANQQGLGRISCGHRDLGYNLVDLFTPTYRCIDLCGYTLHTVLQDAFVMAQLRKKLELGTTIRILISGTQNSDIFDNIDSTNSKPMVGQIETVIEWLKNLRSSLTEEQQNRLSVRCLNRGKLTISMLRFDQSQHVSIYLRATYISQTPILFVERENTSLFKTFQAEFDHFFSQGTSIW